MSVLDDVTPVEDMTVEELRASVRSLRAELDHVGGEAGAATRNLRRAETAIRVAHSSLGKWLEDGGQS